MKKALLILLPLVALVGVGSFVIWQRGYRVPPPRDFAAEYTAIENEGGPHDPAAWAALVACEKRLGEELGRWAEQLKLPMTREAAFMVGDGRERAEYVPDFIYHAAEDLDQQIEAWRLDLNPGETLDTSHLAYLERDNELIERYAASDLPELVTERLRVEGLSPPSMSGLVREYGTMTRSTDRMWHVTRAEIARLRMSLETGDAPSAIEAMHNLDRVSRAYAHTTGSIGLLEHTDGWSAVREAAHVHLRRGDPEPEFIDAALPLILELHAAQRPLLQRALRIDRVLAQAEVARVYEVDESASAPDAPRLLWLSHATLAKSVDRVFDEWDAYAEAGPTAPVKPGAEQSSWSQRDQEDLYTPVYLTTMPVSRVTHHTFREECASGGVALMLAIESHRARFSSLPVTLEDLVERGIIDTLPADPFAPDGQFLYETDNAQPLGYTLRSVLPDGAPSPRDQWIDTHDTGALHGQLRFDEPGDWSLAPLTKESTPR